MFTFISPTFVLEKFPDFENVFHSLDVWHKASKISKKLAEVSVLHIHCLLDITCSSG